MKPPTIIEHPCPFQPPLVREILAERKTITRRPLTELTATIDGPSCSRKLWAELDFSRAVVDPGPSPAGNAGPYLKVPRRDDHDERVHRVYPRWRAGDRLWCRENWRPRVSHACTIYACDCADVVVRYEADGAETFFEDTNPPVIPDSWTIPKAADRGWVPSMHMPRWASRIDLEITAVGIERVQAITEEDAAREGISTSVVDPSPRGLGPIRPKNYVHARDVFADIWRGIYGADTWERNDWCLRFAFKLLRPSPKAQ